MYRTICILISIVGWTVAYGQQTYSWISGGGDSNWDTPANWSSTTGGLAYPGSPAGSDTQDVANFTAGGGSSTVTLDDTFTIGTLNFAGVYNIGNTVSNELQFSLVGSGGSIISTASANSTLTFTAPITANGDLNIQLNSATGDLVLALSDLAVFGSCTMSGTSSLQQTVQISGTGLFLEGLSISDNLLLQLSSATALGTFLGVTVDGSTVQFDVSPTFTSPVPFILIGDAIFDTQAYTATLSGNISDISGSLTKISSGTLILSGTNTYTGTTTISGGILSIGASNNIGAAAVSIGTATLTLTNGFTLPNNIGLTGAGTIDTGANTDTLSGNITGVGSLVKAGAGTLILTGAANTYSGGTTVSVGTLQGTTTSLQGAIAITGGANVTFTQTTSGTYAGIMSSSGAVNINAAPSTVIFSGANTYSGGTNVNTGTLQGTTTSLQGAISVASGSIVNFTQAASGTYAGVISGNGAVTINATTGPVIFSGANLYSGGTTVNTGTLQGTTTSLQGAISIASGASVNFTQSPSGTYAGVMSGLGSVSINATSGPVIFSGANSYSGGTTVNAGTLQGTTTSLQGAISIASGATVNFTQAPSGTYASVMSGLGAVSINATSGPIIFSGANSYSGGTTVNTGTLEGTTTSLQGAISIAGSATVAFNQMTSGTYAGVMSNAGSVTVNAGTAIITFGGANTYSGNTTVSTGSLQGTTTSLQGNIALASGTTLIFQQSGTGTYSTGNPGAITGMGGLTMKGPGTVILTGTNTYSGPTIISGGILSIGSNSNIGASTVSIGGGTLLFSSSFTFVPGVSLTGVGTIDTGPNNNTMSGVVSGIGSFVKTGSGTLTLLGANNYSGGTTVSQGTLAGTTTSLQGAIAIASGASVAFTQATSGTYAGVMSGLGALIVNAAPATVTLSGINTYSGGTTVNTGTLQGTTTSLQGPMTLNGSGVVSFTQATSGSYAGVLTSASTSSDLVITGGGAITVSGNSPAFLGATAVTGNSTLIVTGTLSSSPVTVASGSTLMGNGSVGSITNEGILSPGLSGVGTLTANGALSSDPASTFQVLLTPTTNSLLMSTANIGIAGTLDLEIMPGFYGVGQRYILAQGASLSGTFSSIVLSNLGFQAEITYTGTQLILDLISITPFFEFPFANANERSVGYNLDALSLAGELSASFAAIIDSFVGESIESIDDALDQMHPAALSALAQTQVELGAELLSVLHHKKNVCFCHKKNQLWVEPFGNWLHVKQQGMEIGFHTTTRGVVAGVEREFFNTWTVGFSGGYSASDLKWRLHRGFAYMQGAFGALYSDLQIDRFYLGLSAYGGKDWTQANRHLDFTIVDAYAKSSFSSFDAGAQMNLAYYFGVERFLIYPYAQIDYLYLKSDGFTEEGAGVLNLEVQKYISSTLRVETGGAFRFVDRNREGTMCISPFFGMGYVWERPLNRTPYRANFIGTTIPFTTWGWDQVWQLLNLKMGLAIVYRCFTLDSEFIANISPDGGSPFVNQRANFRMSYGF